MIALGIFGENLLGRNFLLRSGIAKGDLSSAKWDEKKDPFFIGMCMANAHSLEDSQNWFGGCISKDIDCSKVKSDFIIEYDSIPLNSDKCKGYAINWIEAAKQSYNEIKIKMDLIEENICKQIQDISYDIGFSDKKEKEKSQIKIKNTQNFINYCLK